MSSNNIVRDIRTHVDTKIIPSVPKKWIHQFNFGLQAYGLKQFQSAGSNARSVVPNAHTAGTKTDRLLGNDRLANQCGHIFDQLHLVKPNSYVSVDHSDMHGLTALVGAIQTRKGRSVPCFIETTYALQIPAHSPMPSKQKLRSAMVSARRTQSFAEHTIGSLQTFADRLGFWPKLVFDRGFGNESIVTHLHAIVRIYHHRFEIEETFKDTKHLFELQRLHFMKPNSLKVVLWLVFLGIAILYVVTKPTKQQTKATNPKKHCSWVRQAYEQFQRELTKQRELTGRQPRTEVVR